MFGFLLRRRRQEEELPLEIYVSLVDWLYANPFSLLSGAAGVSIAMLLTAWKTDFWMIWLCAAALALVSATRAADMWNYAASTAPRTHEVVRSWEVRYAVGAAIAHALLGLWCFVSIRFTPDATAHLISATMTVAYAATGSGRNCGRPYIVNLQFMTAIGPLAAALLLNGDPYYAGLGLMSLFFFAGQQRITFMLYQTILKSLNTTRDMTSLAVRFDTALNNMPHGLCMFDSEGRLVVGNSRLSQLLGIAQDLAHKDMTVWEMLYD